MARSMKPKIHIDDLHLGEQDHAFHASWQDTGVIAEITLDIVVLNHWQHGQYREHAYELTNAIRAVRNWEMSALQKETALMWLDQLHIRMLAAMTDAGWREVAKTRDGQPVYQYHPAPQLSDEEMEEVAAAFAEFDQADDLDDQAEHPVKLYEVYGARSKEHGPAYTRRVTARTATFSCAICGAPVTRECYPGLLPKYCGSEECKREAVRQRVERYRANKQQSQE